ncbi:MAG: N-carbamoyl-D-amino-acid hydrolase [Nostoc sp.]|uniref:N-carbamoyl-D-amino-acid hydrolase n=1 Tax=Nostoc sp. TaxID=1180 RepID=UPI002FFAAA2F
MARIITVGAAQLGPIARNDSRTDVINRLIDLMKQAKSMGCELIVFPELALTTFFPRWYMENQVEIDAFFETDMPSTETLPLFELSAHLEIGFYLGYAELTIEKGQTHRYNTSILVNKSGQIIGKYRKIHVPGHIEYKPEQAFQHLERRYFDIGNLGFQVWHAFDGIIGMCICNDRRWSETYRVMGLQNVEMILIGYSTPQQTHLSQFHNHLVMQDGAYQNATWVVGVAKAGREEGCDLIGDSAIIAPSGEIVAKSITLGDELIVARCNLDLCQPLSNFEVYRQPQYYQPICEQKSVTSEDV